MGRYNVAFYLHLLYFIIPIFAFALMCQSNSSTKTTIWILVSIILYHICLYQLTSLIYLLLAFFKPHWLSLARTLFQNPPSPIVALIIPSHSFLSFSLPSLKILLFTNSELPEKTNHKVKHNKIVDVKFEYFCFFFRPMIVKIKVFFYSRTGSIHKTSIVVGII